MVWGFPSKVAYLCIVVHKLWRKWGYDIVDRCHKPINPKNANAQKRTGSSNAAAPQAVAKCFCAERARAALGARCRAMLPKHKRLSAQGVRDVLKLGRSARGSVLSVKYISGGGPFCAAVVVSKSVAKRAVDRNKLRRAVYHALGLPPTPALGRAVFFVQKKADISTLTQETAQLCLKLI